jgi:ketosteroid isomerase-like protein
VNKNDGPFPSCSRRLTLLLGLAPFCADAATPAQDVVATLFQRADEANGHFIRGEMREWFARISPIADDFTLMMPFGGEVFRGVDRSADYLARLSTKFRKGEGRAELLASYVSADIVVLVMIERQRGEVHGLPVQDWSLRVTLVFQRDGGEWVLAHRHADPLVKLRTAAETAPIARGVG